MSAKMGSPRRATTFEGGSCSAEMGHAGGQGADRFHFFGLDQLAWTIPVSSL